jgi:hypothetical protein
MTSPSSAPNKQTANEFWNVMVPYFVPPLAASVAIIPSFRDMVAKSAQQRGQPIPSMTVLENLKGGLKAAPTVGAIVGTQMVVQRLVEKALTKESDTENLSSTLASSAIVGIASAPVLAVFNGQTMGLSVRESIQKFSIRQGLAISVQETAFVGGLSVADKLAVIMKRKFGNNKVVDYTAAFIAGATGSLAGHPANTALTRWQSGMQLDSFSQSMWGAARKARAVGCFSVVYKFAKEILNPNLEEFVSKKGV